MSTADKEPISNVVWASPPEIRTKYDWRKIAEQLHRRPQEWARIFENDRVSIVNAIRQGSIAVLDPTLGFEVRTRNNSRAPIRMCSLYMRYVPEKDRRR
jgi:hypothetical protein